MLDVVSQWVAHYGYVLVALFLFIEAAGVPVPARPRSLPRPRSRGGERSRSPASSSPAASARCSADTRAIGSARAAATRFSMKHGQVGRADREAPQKTHDFFQPHGAKTVLLGRFVAFVRSFLGIFAGLSGMPMRTFAPYNAIGGVDLGPDVHDARLHVRTQPAAARAVHRAREPGARAADRGRRRRVLPLALVREQPCDDGADARPRYETATDDTAHERDAREASAGVPDSCTRWAQGEYLALHLAIGFVISLTVIAIFASISEGLVDSSPLTRFDVAIAARLQASAAPIRAQFFRLVSGLGGRGAMTLLLIGGAAAVRGAPARQSSWRAGSPHSSARRRSMPRCASSCVVRSCRLPISS